MKQSFFLFDRCLGSRDIPATWKASETSHAWPAVFRHRNLALCCPVCGEIWGRVVCTEALPGWLFENRNCPKHPDTGLGLAGWVDWKRGSFIYPFDDPENPLTFAPDWPDDLVRHEFKMLMQKLDKEQQP